MKELNKDLLLLFLYSMSNTLYYIWPIIYPYLGSYVKHYNQDLSMKMIFSTTIAMVFGITLGNIILPRLYFLFGIKKTMQIGGFCILVNCVLFYSFSTFFPILFNVLFCGTIYQLCIMSISYYLSEKYDNGYIYCNYVYVGQNVANIIWPYVAVFLINPNNKGMTDIFEEGGETENYFPWEISENFPLLMKTIGIVSFLIVMITTYFLKDPKHIKANFLPWIKALVKGNKSTLDSLSKSFKEQSFNSFSRNLSEKEKSFKSSMNLSKDDDCLLIEENKKEMTMEEAQAIASKISYSPYVLVFTLLISLRLAPLFYMVDNFKVISFGVLKNDKTISLSLSLSALISSLGQICIAPIWKKLDFFYTQALIFILTVINLVLYLKLSVNYGFFMFWILPFNRIIIQMAYGAGYLTKFGLFNPKIAVFVSKVIDNYYFISMVIAIIFNFLFFSQKDISTIFGVFLILNVIATVIFIVYFKNFKNIIKVLQNN